MANLIILNEMIGSVPHYSNALMAVGCLCAIHSGLVPSYLVFAPNSSGLDHKGGLKGGGRAPRHPDN